MPLDEEQWLIMVNIMELVVNCYIQWTLRSIEGNCNTTAQVEDLPECALARIPYYDIIDECSNISCYDNTEYHANNLMLREEWYQLIQGGKQ